VSEAGGLLRKLVHEWDHVELQVERLLHGRRVVIVLVEPLRVVGERPLG
jgi:hypothetical protein